MIPTAPDAWDLWLGDAPWDGVKHLQRPLPDHAPQVVARDVREDETAPA